ncbi:uncharacterized protein LOC123867043 [Maniola jurtina]|uniref:uncharacterized protein LOC123867043 n=1 Tax=Maniola jurtina TaxID=191418 RepID=UPI001E68E961|nr:uncharacterized protein LOC123867043 [Maniola jurtina]
MIFILVMGTSLFMFTLGKSSNSAVSAMSFHRYNIPSSDDYSTMHFYDKDSKNGYRYNRNRNIQYAPLVFQTKQEESLTKFYKKITMPASTVLLDLPEISTEENNVQPQVNKQYNAEYKNENWQAITRPNLSGHNIKLLPKTNELVCKSELKPGFGNIDYSDRSTRVNIRSNVHKSNLNGKLSKLRVHQDNMTRFSRKNAVTDSYKSQRIFERFHQKHKPIKHIIQVLPASENAKIQPILNPYYIIGSRLHLNIARALKIAHAQNKAPQNGHRKRIRINKLNHFVSNIDELIKNKSFLTPSKNTL